MSHDTFSPDLVDVFSGMAEHHGRNIAEKCGFRFSIVPERPIRYWIGAWPLHWSIINDYFAADPPAELKIVHWIGTDVLLVAMGLADTSFFAPDIHHFAGWSNLQSELRQSGLESTVVVNPCRYYPEFREKPGGDAVVLALDWNRPAFFHKEVLDQIAADAQDRGREVIWLPPGPDQRIDLEPVFERASTLVRLPMHDGFGCLPAEFMMAGLEVITTQSHYGQIQVQPDTAVQIFKRHEVRRTGETRRRHSGLYRDRTDPRHTLEAIETLWQNRS